MSTSQVWETDAAGGYMYADELSDTLRTALQPLTKFRQMCEPDADALAKGLNRGDKYRWNVYGDVATQGRRLSELSPMPETTFSVSQSELTVVELGNSVPYTGKLTALQARRSQDRASKTSTPKNPAATPSSTASCAINARR